MQIYSRYTQSTYRYAHHMGSGERIPAFAEAWVVNSRGERSADISLCGDDFPNLEGHELTAKAVAILRRQIGH